VKLHEDGTASLTEVEVHRALSGVFAGIKWRRGEGLKYMTKDLEDLSRDLSNLMLEMDRLAGQSGSVDTEQEVA
jgi:multimeric flavodoxin WrbA